MRLVWDEAKRRSNLAKHGLDFADLPLEFFLTAKIEPSRMGRFLAIGLFRGEVVLAVVGRPLGAEALSIISMRRANGRERMRMDV